MANKNVETKLPMKMNLQFFAEDSTDMAGTDEGGDTTQNDSVDDGKPTVEELLAQLATERAEKERFKAANDKLSKSEAELKRRERARMSTAEQEEEARKEAEAQRQKEYDDAMAELNKMKAEQAYNTVISNADVISNMVEAVNDKDHNSIALIIKSEVEKAVKEKQAEWLKTRPQVSAGAGTSTMTKEEIMAIADPIEQQRAIAQNIHLFQ